MSEPERTPIQVACDNVIAASREHIRAIEQLIGTLGRIRELRFQHSRDAAGIRDFASQLQNIAVDLRRKVRFQEIAKGLLELERNLTHALEGGRGATPRDTK